MNKINEALDYDIKAPADKIAKLSAKDFGEELSTKKASRTSENITQTDILREIQRQLLVADDRDDFATSIVNKNRADSLIKSVFNKKAERIELTDAQKNTRDNILKEVTPEILKVLNKKAGTDFRNYPEVLPE